MAGASQSCGKTADHLNLTMRDAVRYIEESPHIICNRSNNGMKGIVSITIIEH